MLGARSRPVRLLIAAACAIGVGAPVAARVAQSQRDGESLARKLAIVTQNGLFEPAEPRLTTVTEQEVNAYLKFQAADRIPAGVVDPHLTIKDQGRLSGRATVDLDEVRRQGSGGWLDPLSYLAGRLPITATGVLHTADGVGRLEVETVEVAGVRVPKPVLREVVSYYSRTAADPDGVNLDEPFVLPARIREVRVSKGQAVIVQ